MRYGLVEMDFLTATTKYISSSTELWVDKKFKGIVDSIHYEKNDEDTPITWIYMKGDLYNSSPEVFCFQGSYQVEWDNEGGKISISLGGPDEILQTHKLQDLVPGLMATIKCPACPQDPNIVVLGIALWNIIIHLNDEHKWDRLRTADWLESLDIDLTFKEVNDVRN